MLLLLLPLISGMCFTDWNHCFGGHSNTLADILSFRLSGAQNWVAPELLTRRILRSVPPAALRLGIGKIGLIGFVKAQPLQQGTLSLNEHGAVMRTHATLIVFRRLLPFCWLSLLGAKRIWAVSRKDCG
jgi:hypothetical protein